MMQAAGFEQLRGLFLDFRSDAIDKQLANLQLLMDEDEQRLKEQMDEQMMKNYGDPKDVYDAVRARTEGTQASDYFLSMMQHLLLIREEGPALAHYYQLLDSIVTDVVLDKKLAGAEGRLGNSVSKIIASLNDAERVQALDSQVQEFRSQALRFKLEKEALEEEIAAGGEGMVGRLKDDLAHLEEKLAISRATTARLQGQLEAQKAGYEEQINQLEAQIMALFEMLRNIGRDVRQELEKMDDGSMDRKALISRLDRHLQRSMTKDILEGRKEISKGISKGDFVDGVDEDAEHTPRPGTLKRAGKKGQTPKGAHFSEAPGRISQFMDAEDAEEEEQMQQQLANSVNAVSTSGDFISMVNSRL
jgi:cytokinesis protein